MNINIIKDKIQKLREENILKMTPLPANANGDSIALNTRANEFRLGVDVGYEMVLGILKEDCN